MPGCAAPTPTRLRVRSSTTQRSSTSRGHHAMTILWDSDPAAAETYRFAVSDHIEVVEVAQMVTRALTASPSELLVIVGPDVDQQSAMHLAEQVRAERPEVSVVLLRRRLDVTVMGQAL